MDRHVQLPAVRRSAAFTLVELVTTLAVTLTALAVGVPAFESLIDNQRIHAGTNRLVAHLQFARSEAVKRDVRVIMCRTANPNSSSPVCGGSEKTWTTGYIIFADDGNYTNNLYNSSTDILLRRGQVPPSGVDLRGNAIWNKNLIFNPNGTTHEDGNTAEMSICDDRGTVKGRQIIVAASGIPKLHSGGIDTCYP